MRSRARFVKIYTLPLQGSWPMASVMIPLRGVKTLAHISRAVIQQIAHIVLKVEHMAVGLDN